MTQASLVSLAILKVNWDNKGHDYVDNFLPFVAEALRKCAEHISVAELQKVIREEFGLVIPQGALNTLLRRAERRGLVIRESGVFTKNGTPVDSNFARERQDLLRKQNGLFAKLLEFVRDRYNQTWSELDAQNALLNHLHSYCVPILAASLDGCAIPAIGHKTPHSEFIVNAFITHLYERDPEGFAFLEAVAKGNMLATALFLPDIGKASQKFKGLTVYLDTRILLRALGLEGTGQQEPTLEFINLLYSLNISLACFDITRDELRRILDAAQNALRDPNLLRKGLFSVYENFVSAGYRASDVEMVVANLDIALRRLHIHVKDKPPFETILGLNEVRLGEIVKELLPSQSEDAQRHDIDCITAIHRLRRGKKKDEIETCECIFVTTNNALARAATVYFIEAHERLTVPLCINDHTMATLAWVKNPTLADNWAREKLIADSYAALHPGNELWRKYSQEISKLQDQGDLTVEDYQLLRFSIVARNALMDSTLGSPDAFTEGTVQEVLETARAEARRETELKLNVAVEKQREAETVARLANESMRSLVRRQQDKIRSVAAAIGAGVRWLAYAVTVALVTIGFYTTLPAIVPEIKLFRFLPAIALTVFSFFAIYSLITGGSIRGFARSIEIRVTAFATKVLSNLAGIPTTVDGTFPDN
jgi:hypothetical protein